MIVELGDFIIKVLLFLAADDLALIAFGFCFLGLAFSLAYNLSGSEKL